MNLSELTTMRVGGPARRIVSATTADELVAAARAAWRVDEPCLVLGGGSNVVVADDGVDGTVIRVQSRGIELRDGGPGSDGIPRPAVLRVQAGEPWDAVVAFAVEAGLGGIEALSGIPGSSGAAPIQNIGAYGQELSDTLVSIDFLDAVADDVVTIPAADLELAYRTSAIKQGREGVVLAIELALEPVGDDAGSVVRYEQLAKALGVQIGERVPLAEVRRAVLALRASKGMVLDPEDPDSVSCGSFFTNPIVTENFARSLPSGAPRWPMEEAPADVIAPVGEPALPPPSEDARVKLSAAWLIEQAGVSRGFALPGSRAQISSKHTLAIVNGGGATAEEVAQLARFVSAVVVARFGVLLHPEPVLVGFEF
jgi:UDP-N-acetylmuramate dehydrogenase